MEYSKISNEEFPRKHWSELSGSKGDNFKNLKKNFDYTLPQEWLNSFSSDFGLDYFKISGTTVWAYEKGDNFGFPISCCVEVQRWLEKYYYNK